MHFRTRQNNNIPPQNKSIRGKRHPKCFIFDTQNCTRQIRWLTYFSFLVLRLPSTWYGPVLVHEYLGVLSLFNNRSSKLTFTSLLTKFSRWNVSTSDLLGFEINLHLNGSSRLSAEHLVRMYDKSRFSLLYRLLIEISCSGI